MGSYKLLINKNVRKKDLPKIPLKHRRKIINMIAALQDDPRPTGAMRLTNREEYRIRYGDYRILYLIEDTVKVVQVERVATRGEVYK